MILYLNFENIPKNHLVPMIQILEFIKNHNQHNQWTVAYCMIPLRGLARLANSMQIRISLPKFLNFKEYKKYKNFHFWFNMICREYFKFKVLSADHFKPEMKFFIFWIHLRVQELWK